MSLNSMKPFLWGRSVAVSGINWTNEFNHVKTREYVYSKLCDQTTFSARCDVIESVTRTDFLVDELSINVVGELQ